MLSARVKETKTLKVGSSSPSPATHLLLHLLASSSQFALGMHSLSLLSFIISCLSAYLGYVSEGDSGSAYPGEEGITAYIESGLKNLSSKGSVKWLGFPLLSQKMPASVSKKFVSLISRLLLESNPRKCLFFVL